MHHETAIFGQKTNPEIPVFIIFCLFSSLPTTKTQNIAETPYFIVFSKHKKEKTQKITYNIQKMLAPFSDQKIRDLPDKWAPKQHKMIIEFAKIA